MTKPTTVYLDTRVLQVVKMKAVQTHQSVSRLVNEALRLTLKEDAADIQAIHDRKHESVKSYETVLKDLKKDGLL